MPSALSTDALSVALNGRVDQGRLKLAVEDLVRPHFYETPEDRIRDVAVLVRDLAEFSDDVAGWAVREWRLSHDRRPTSAALRQLCMRRRYELTKALKRRETRPEAEMRLSPEERAERRAQVEQILRDVGLKVQL